MIPESARELALRIVYAATSDSAEWGETNQPHISYENSSPILAPFSVPQRRPRRAAEGCPILCPGQAQDGYSSPK